MAAKKNTGETKEAKFKRLASLHANRAIKSIRRIGTLNTKAYESKPDQHKKILDTLKEEVLTLDKRFRGEKATKEAFSL